MILPAELLEKLRRAKANGDPKKYMAFVTVEEAHLIASSVAAAESLAAQALRERDEAREALGPFAREAASWSAELWADTFVPVITPSVTEPGDNEKAAFTVGDLRRARALSEQPDKERT